MLELELTLTDRDAQLVEEAQMLMVEAPFAMPSKDSVLPERFACTMLGLELEDT